MVANATVKCAAQQAWLETAQSRLSAVTGSVRMLITCEFGKALGQAAEPHSVRVQ